MQVACRALIGALSLTFLFIFIGAHNITRILAKHPEFSTFNHYLTVTHLVADINRRQTITVRVVDNSAMSDLLSKGYSVYTLLFRLHITGRKVAFGALDDTGDYKLTSTFVKTVQEMPYNISVIQVSHVMASPDAEALTAPPTALNQRH
ncbi:fasciclin-like arabinogalactan protein 2 [Impatiens glandulifera]|uniref:fasciclin-like arabinogalactan protein 2 n=1 Tax=Impatiens glandulifera TaxID=253017 RepID=UPI001FB1945F|nr:fasciclin-like arabinogalactan protein 2 [Impatiens glandulifera]